MSAHGSLEAQLRVGQRDQWHRRKQPSYEATARGVSTLDEERQIGWNVGTAAL
jgi:hypothetical protein